MIVALPSVYWCTNVNAAGSPQQTCGVDRCVLGLPARARLEVRSKRPRRTRRRNRERDIQAVDAGGSVRQTKCGALRRGVAEEGDARRIPRQCDGVSNDVMFIVEIDGTVPAVRFTMDDCEVVVREGRTAGRRGIIAMALSDEDCS